MKSFIAILTVASAAVVGMTQQSEAGLFCRSAVCSEPAPVCCQPAPVCCPEPVCCAAPVCAPEPVCCPAPVCCPQPRRCFLGRLFHHKRTCCEPAPTCCPEPACGGGCGAYGYGVAVDGPHWF
ncbi:MAG: hypothetical protein KDA81_04265 [Planctomycetaceae bacterium]|nr:hypothetical protein [Planctomycetaceae bacterium]